DFGGGGDVGEGEAEGFDHKPAVVVDAFEGVEVFAPADETLAGGAAVVFADVDVAEHVGTGVEGEGNRFFLDVGMERVVHHAAAGVIDFAAEAGGVGVGVEQVRLEPVEAFDAERRLDLAGVHGR